MPSLPIGHFPSRGGLREGDKSAPKDSHRSSLVTDHLPRLVLLFQRFAFRKHGDLLSLEKNQNGVAFSSH